MSPTEGGGLTPEQKRARLAELLRARGGQPVRHRPTAGQRALWLLHKLEPGLSAYHVNLAAIARPGPDLNAWRAALAALVARHPALRSAFPEARGEPEAAVAPPGPVALEVLDGRAWSEAELRARLRAVAARPFDLAQGPLYRFAAVELGPGATALQLTVHHLAVDGASFNLLLEELGQLYQAQRSGTPAALSPAPSYADFAARQEAWLASPEAERAWAYWRERLEGLPTLELGPPPGGPSGGAQHRFALGPLEAIQALSRAEGATPYAVLLTAYLLALHRLSGQSDLAVGSMANLRDGAGEAGLVGYAVNPVVLRSVLEPGDSFRAALARVRRATLEALEQRAFPFPTLVERLRPSRSGGRSPLLGATFRFDQFGPEAGELTALALGEAGRRATLAGLELESLDLDLQLDAFDLTLGLHAHDGQLVGAVRYATDRHDAAFAAALASAFTALLRAALADPDRPVRELPLVDAEAQRQLMESAEGPARAYDLGQPVQALFEAQAARAPGAVALRFQGAELSYAELQARAGRLAGRLRALGVGPGVRVGVLMERSPELVVALLGTLQAGGAYLPLDPAYPAGRLAFMAGDAQAKVVLTQRRHARLLEAAQVLCLDEPEPAEAPSAPARAGSPEDAAYVIYTSGSTGQPKGVAVPHRAIVNHLLGRQELFPLEANERCLAKASISFDISLWELLGPLSFGAALVLAAPGGEREPAYLARVAVEERLTQLHFGPAMLRLFLEEPALGQAQALRRVFVGGEPLTPALAARFFERSGARLIHQYGPTEACVDVTFFEVARGAPEARLPIGRPMPNTRARVLGPDLELLPPGAAGELCLGGACLALGYLNRETETKARFVADPHAPGALLYRTGDRARLRPDGQLEFLGRLDGQVKIRGFRIEPGEVEAALLALPGVRAAVAGAVESARAGAHLVAWVVGPAEAELPELRAQLAARLPEHLVPAALVPLERLPLTANGKLDRRALPAPDFSRASRPAVARDALEARLSELLAEVLGLPRVGPDDSFFELGGHSLLAVRALARVQRELGAEVPLGRFFASPTAAGLASAVRATATQAHIAPAPEGELALASFAQERLWFLDRLQPGAATYNVPLALELSGELDAAALERALAELEMRHEALRTTLREQDGQVLQVLQPPALRVLRQDLRGRPEEADRLAHADAARPFDLERGPLWRATLLRTGERAHLLLLCFHHAATDGWSNGVLLRELGELYAAFAQGRAPALPAPPLRYADYARWQRQQLQGERQGALAAYWKGQLTGAPALELPTDRPRPAARSGRGGHAAFRLEAAPLRRLTALAREEQGTLFTALLAGYGLLLSRYAGQDEVVVGTPTAGRERAELEGVVGFFVNTLALRLDLSGQPSFRELVRRARRVQVEALEHQELPFEKVVEVVNPERAPGRTPLVQTMLALQDEPALPSFGLAATRRWYGSATAKFDLTLTLGQAGEALEGALEFCADLFEPETIARLARHLARLLGAASESPDAPAHALPLLDDAERAELLQLAVSPANPDPRTLLERFEAQADRTPDAPAAPGLSYAALEARANGLAALLRERGVAPGQPVALLATRSVEHLVANLAVHKAGAAVALLDPAYPPARVASVLADLGSPLLLGPAALLARLAPAGSATLALDGPEARRQAPRAGHRPAPNDLAYVIFTSGSTGQPKGVEVEHAGIASALGANVERYGPATFARVAVAANPAFDASLLDVWLPLITGGEARIPSDEDRLDPHRLLAWLHRERITHVFLTTPLAELVLAETPPPGLALQVLSTGGDKLRRGLRGPRPFRVLNNYGPTEISLFCTWGEVAEGEAAPPIGRPAPGARVYLLDAALQPVPRGVAGELYVGGQGVARGYRGLPEQTRERFLPDPFAPGGRIYRTGDRARLRPDGQLEFLGRADGQVKIRGYRVEPAEVEASLLSAPGVRGAAVVAFAGADGEKRLAAYLALGEGAGLEAVQAHVAGRLPEYMLPASWQVLAELPLTASGKLDRRALPAPQAPAPRPRAAPRDALEGKLAALLAEVLGLPEVGADDSFFELGGHSLLAVRALSRVERELGKRVPLAAFLAAPSAHGLASQLRAGVETHRARLRVPLQPRGNRPPLFLVHPVGGGVLCYFGLARSLGDDQPVYGLQSPALAGEALPSTVEELAARYLEEVRQLQPRGPYRLGGWSLGGVIAFAMAEQLLREGERASPLVLIDSWAPRPGSPPAPGEESAWFVRNLVGELTGLRAEPGPAHLPLAEQLRRALASLGREDVLPGSEVLDQLDALHEAYRQHLGLARAYRPRGGVPHLRLLRAAGRPSRVGDPPELGWATFAGPDFRSAGVPGDHYSLVTGSGLPEVASHLRAWLDEAGAEAG